MITTYFNTSNRIYSKQLYNLYSYGYNGMEKDDEVSGNGNSYTTEFRQYDPRLGRWKSLDPLMTKFPWMSPYVAFDNNPVYFVDPYGLASGTGDQDGGPGGENPDGGDGQNENEDGLSNEDKDWGYGKNGPIEELPSTKNGGNGPTTDNQNIPKTVRFKVSELNLSKEMGKIMRHEEGKGPKNTIDEVGNETHMPYFATNEEKLKKLFTIGYGHTYSSAADILKFEKGINEKDALALFESDVKKMENYIKKKFTVDLGQNEYDALIFSKYNGGIGSTFLYHFATGTTTDINTLHAVWLLRRNKGQTSEKGLTTRREYEWLIYTTGDYKQPFIKGQDSQTDVYNNVIEFLNTAPKFIIK
jgi:RHS repeat-associated protein